MLARTAALQSGSTFRVMRPHGTVRTALDLTGTCQLLTHVHAPGQSGRSGMTNASAIRPRIAR